MPEIERDSNGIALEAIPGPEAQNVQVCTFCGCESSSKANPSAPARKHVANPSVPAMTYVIESVLSMRAYVRSWK